MNRRKKPLSLLLAAVLLLSLGVGVVPARAAKDAAPAVTDPGEPVRMIVELAEPKAFPLNLFSSAPSREDVKDAIRDLIEKAAPLSAESEAAPEVTFGYDYSVLLQGFSLTAPEGYLDEIRALKGVRSAFKAETYTIIEPEGGWSNAESQAVVGTQDAHARGYTGEGQVIAVLDTMLLPEHEAFSGAVPSPKLSKADVAEKLPSLTIAGEASADDLWRSDKVPFCFDYYDSDADVTSDNPHGTHVSGIAAANGGEIIGVAPDAQLIYMKVFDSYDSASDDAILAALEDAVILGADCVNMSLGSDGGFAAYPNETTQRVYENLRAADVTLCCSAGNEGLFSVLNWPTPLYMPDTSTVGSPASYDAALAVANMTMKSYARVRAGEKEYYVVDGSNRSEGTIPPLSTLGEAALPAVDCGDGTEFPAEAAGAAAVIDLRSYWDGYTQMYLRAQEAGAKLIVFCLDETWQYAEGFAVDGAQVPLVFMAYGAGQEILEAKAPVSASGEPIAVYPPDNSSSWGPAPDLKLKPEIAGIGAQVYSAVATGTADYERMSGTSMSSPQVAGEMTLLRQYLKAQNYDTPLTLTQLAETLIMSSAVPVTNPVDGGGFISPRQQGAGMGNVVSAMDAKAWISVPGCERPKAELGVGEGSFSFTFTVHNLTNEPLTYSAEVLALAQDPADGRFALSSTNYAGTGVDVDAPDTVSVPAGGEQTVTVKLTVTDALREAMQELENGFFLDGFVRLYAAEGSGSDLGLPYLAFVGDWNAAPLLDLEGLHAAPRLVNFQGMPLGANPVEIVEVEDAYGSVHEEPWVDPDALSISPLVSGFQSETVLLRPASYISATMTDEAGAIIRQYEGENARRSTMASSAAREFMESQLEGGSAFYAFDLDGEWLPEGWYNYTVTARLAGGERAEEWSERIFCDWTEPKLEYEISGEPGSRVLTLTASDNFKLSYFAVMSPGNWIQSPDALAVTDRGMEQDRYAAFPGVRSIEKADGVYTLTLDLESFLQHQEQLGLRTDVLQLEAEDYAGNGVHEILPLTDDFYPMSVEVEPAELYLSPGDEARLQAIVLPEGCKHNQITWESRDPDIATVDENGVVHAVSEGDTVILAHAEYPEGTFPMMAICPVSVFRYTPSGYQITFDPMGGECPVASLYTIEAEGLPTTLLSYPPAEREGYEFLGWFLEPEGGEPLEPFYLFEGDTTLYAHWASLEPVEPTEPTESTEPVVPTESTEPTIPTESAEPTESPEVKPCDGGENCPSKAFTDVDRTAKSWYHEAVDWAVVQKITNGRDAAHFAPTAVCTRAEAVTFLWRAAGSPEVQNGKNPFTDVKESDYFYRAVLWAVQEGVTNGVSEISFAPKAECTRAHIVTFLFRAAKAAAPEGDNPFTDVPANTWYTDSVLWAVQEGITNGDGRADIFHPNQGCNRAMIVTFLYRTR